MENIFLEVLNLSIIASWLVLAVLVMRLILRKAPKWINCLLWLIVGIRLVCPFSIESALSLIPSAETVPTTITTSQTPEITSGIEAVDRVVNPVITETFSPEPIASVNPLQVITYVASIVWIIGIIAMISYMVISYVRLKMKLHTATLLQDNLYQSEFIKSPFVMGIIKPKIYIPYNIAPENVDKIILHEQAHLKRHDNIIKPIAFLILSVYWFNPVMWLAFVFLCKDIELACDEKVVKSMAKDDKQAYAKTILENSTKDFSVVACPFSFGGGSIKSRIKNIMAHKKSAVWLIVCSLILCVATIVCFLTVPGYKLSHPRDLIYTGKGYGSYIFADWWYDTENCLFAQTIEIGIEYERIECECITGNFYKENVAYKPRKKRTYADQQVIYYNPPIEDDDKIKIKVYICEDVVYNATINVNYLGEIPGYGDIETYCSFEMILSESDGLYLVEPYYVGTDHHARLEINDNSEKGKKVVPFPKHEISW